MKKKLHYYLPLLVSVSMVVGIFIGYRIHNQLPYDKDITDLSPLDKWMEIKTLVESHYVEDKNLDIFLDKGLQYLFADLDPFSKYIPKSRIQQNNENLKGMFFGIGVEFRMIDDTMNILHPIIGGPSEKAGIISGDKILKVGDTTIANQKTPINEIIKHFKGENGKPLRLLLKRHDSLFELDVITGPVYQPNVASAYLISDKIGYIKLAKFNPQSAEEFSKNLQTLQHQGAENLILDLRDNPGGVLSQAVDIADEFLSGEKLITYTKGKASPKKEYTARRKGLFEEGKVVVLVNKNSASASEVVCGALQDWDRATIIGDTTFGKGLVQQQFYLSDGSAIHMTIAKYYTPSGRNIQKPFDTQNINVDTFFSKDGKPLFGGGGIIPNIIINDKKANNGTNTIIRSILKGGNLLKFQNAIFQFVHANKNVIKKKYFAKNKSFSKPFMANVWNIIRKQTGISNTNFSKKERQIMYNEIQKLIVYYAFDNKEYISFINKNDPTISSALKLINKSVIDIN